MPQSSGPRWPDAKPCLRHRGRDTDGSARRPTLTGNYSEPELPWKARKEWLRQVNRVAADCTAKRESYPHKITAVARALAFAGDVCKPSAARPGAGWLT